LIPSLYSPSLFSACPERCLSRSPKKDGQGSRMADCRRYGKQEFLLEFLLCIAEMKPCARIEIVLETYVVRIPFPFSRQKKSNSHRSFSLLTKSYLSVPATSIFSCLHYCLLACLRQQEFNHCFHMLTLKLFWRVPVVQWSVNANQKIRASASAIWSCII